MLCLTILRLFFAACRFYVCAHCTMPKGVRESKRASGLKHHIHPNTRRTLFRIKFYRRMQTHTLFIVIFSSREVLCLLPYSLLLFFSSYSYTLKHFRYGLYTLFLRLQKSLFFFLFELECVVVWNGFRLSFSRAVVCVGALFFFSHSLAF